MKNIQSKIVQFVFLLVTIGVGLVILKTIFD